MGHTLPPWTSKYKLIKVFGNIDNNELAARLGSLSLFDRRGDTFWYDDFESANLIWQTFVYGASSAVALDNTYALSGAQCVKMTVGTSASSVAIIYRTLSYPSKSKLGLEMAFTNEDNIDYVVMGINLYDGAYKHAAEIRYVPSTSELKYQDSDGNFQTFATITGLKDDLAMFNIWKLVADFESEKYTRFILNDTTYDLSSYAYRKTANVTAKYLYIFIQLLSNTGSASSIRVDNAIVTQNEP